MAALTALRNTPRLGTAEQSVLPVVDVPLKANAKPFNGGMVATDSTGYGIAPTANTPGLLVVGCLDPSAPVSQGLDNTGGTNGALVARVNQATRRYANSASTDLIAQKDVGSPCFAVDDQTVALTDNAGQRSPAGIIEAVDASGVYVTQSRAIARFLTDLGGAAEQISASGALTLGKRASILAVSGTKAYTLADGLYCSQRKRVFCKSAASTPSGVLTPAHLAGFTTITFANANAFVDLSWNGTAWDIEAVGGTVTIA